MEKIERRIIIQKNNEEKVIYLIGETFDKLFKELRLEKVLASLRVEYGKFKKELKADLIPKGFLGIFYFVPSPTPKNISIVNILGETGIKLGESYIFKELPEEELILNDSSKKKGRKTKMTFAEKIERDNVDALNIIKNFILNFIQSNGHVGVLPTQKETTEYMYNFFNQEVRKNTILSYVSQNIRKKEIETFLRDSQFNLVDTLSQNERGTVTACLLSNFDKKDMDVPYKKISPKFQNTWTADLSKNGFIYEHFGWTGSKSYHERMLAKGTEIDVCSYIDNEKNRKTIRKMKKKNPSLRAIALKEVTQTEDWVREVLPILDGLGFKEIPLMFSNKLD